MISVVPLELEHLEMLGDPASEPGLRERLDGARAYWPRVIESGTAFSAFAEGRLLGCAGWVQAWPGVAEVWVWETPAIHDYPVAAHKLIQRAVRHLLNGRGYWRISCEVRAGNERGERWVRALGFEREGLLRKRAPDGADTLLYARVR